MLISKDLMIFPISFSNIDGACDGRQSIYLKHVLLDSWQLSTATIKFWAIPEYIIKYAFLNYHFISISLILPLFSENQL